MTDWTSAGAMLLAGVILGAVFLYSMKRRKVVDSDVELRDLEAKRDALLAELRTTEQGSEERLRLERDAANALRQIDAQKSKAAKKRVDAEQPVAAAVRYATIKGFVWGAGSMAVLAGIGFWVMQKAEPKQDMTQAQAQVQQQAPMQAQQQPPDPQIQAMEAAVAKTPDDLALRNQLARAYLDRDNLMGVFQQTQYVLKKIPNDPQALTYQALVRMAMGQPDPARTMLQQAIKSDPKYLDAYVALAWSQTTQGKSSEAQATLDAAAKQHPEQKARLAEVLVKMREQAKMRTEQPTALPPNHPAVGAPGAAGAGALPPNHPPVEAAAAAPSPAAAPGAVPADAVHVTLQLAPGVTAPPGGIIYVIARPAGASAGPPAAVKRMALSAFPLTFDISSADSMMGQPLPAKIHLEARIDSDGDAMTRDPKDPIATADNVATGSAMTLTLHQ